MGRRLLTAALLLLGCAALVYGATNLDDSTGTIASFVVAAVAFGAAIFTSGS